jgi:hypothetical protein
VTDDDGGIGTDTAVLVVDEEVLYRIYVPLIQRAAPVQQFAKLSPVPQFAKLFYILPAVVGLAVRRRRKGKE